MSKLLYRENGKLVYDRKLLAWGIGIGLCFFAVHNRLQPGLTYAFLPQVGFAIIMICMAMLFVNLKEKPDLGPRYFWIPMLVIIGSMAVRVAAYQNMHEVAGLMFLASMFGVYVAARKLGREVFVPFIPFVILEASSVFGFGLAYPGIKTGGIIASPPSIIETANYDIAVVVIIFGATVAMWKHRWVLASGALVALYFTGAAEAVFVMAVLLVIVLVRERWQRRMLPAVVAVAVTVAVCTPLGITGALYNDTIGTLDRLRAGATPVVAPEANALPPPAPSHDDEPALVWGGTGGDIILDSEPYRIEDEVGQYGPYRAWSEEEFADPYATPKWYLLGFTDYEVDEMTVGRWLDYRRTWAEVNPLGHGYELTVYTEETVHNVPLIIVDQIGPAAGAAWLFIAVMGVWRTRWRYAWSAVLALSVWDHFIWTQVAPYWWVLAGVSTSAVGQIKNDYIFKEIRGNGKAQG